MSEIVKSNKKVIANTVFSSSAEKGLEIFIQSDINFACLADKSAGIMTIGGVKCFIPRAGNGTQIPGVPGYFSTEKTVFQLEGYINLSLLLAEKLKDGVKFNFGTFPISPEKLQEYSTSFKQQIKIFYLTYCKPISVETTITAETIEKESHY